MILGLIIVGFIGVLVLLALVANFLQLRTIHKLVNARLSAALARIDQLEALLVASTDAGTVMKEKLKTTEAQA